MHSQDTSFREIPLTRGGVAIVDVVDYEWLSQYRWQCDRGYARRSLPRNRRRVRHVYMHREILRPLPGFEVDHINGNRSDNRRANLRVVTESEQRYNQRPRRDSRSQYKGVQWVKSTGRWLARITQDYQGHHLGVFASEIEAARAYDVAARERFGGHARLNFPEEDHEPA